MPGVPSSTAFAVRRRGRNAEAASDGFRTRCESLIAPGMLGGGIRSEDTPMTRTRLRTILAASLAAALLALTPGVAAVEQQRTQGNAQINSGASEMRDAIERFSADAAALNRSYPVRLSTTRHERLAKFHAEWLAALDAMPFESFSHAAKIDWLLLRNRLQTDMRQATIQRGYIDEAAPLMPFAQTIIDLAEGRRRMERMDGQKTAATLVHLDQQIKAVRKAVEAGLKNDATDTTADEPAPIRVARKPIANRAARYVRQMRADLREWHAFHNGYDPLFTWWMAEPYKQVSATLEDYAKFLREKVVGVPESDTTTVVGDPIGSEALLGDLASELIPYSPEELIAIAHREFDWCRNEMLKASREMGFGDDWKAALEHVKSQHVQPGEQPQMVRELAFEAVQFLEDRDLVTIPDLCKEIWRMNMMSPQQQMIAPFFLGGEVIQVAFPTDAMSHEAKQMTLRGNNIHFARATVHHELIPGHHLQGFMTARYRPYRRAFDTPFWIEGWALYWEMLLWDEGFPQSPENKVGMLFWRMHRCARIIFSLSFHLEKMTPQECIDLLVNEVGHERANAEAEVRRSFEGDYGPLYQIAYMIGGLQIRAMHEELVGQGGGGGGGGMTKKEFHDAILRENSIPIELLRAILMKQDVGRDFKSSWRFADE